MARWVVTVQARKEWPARGYDFTKEGQARMFLRSCKNDRAYQASIAGPFA